MLVVVVEPLLVGVVDVCVLVVVVDPLLVVIGHRSVCASSRCRAAAACGS